LLVRQGVELYVVLAKLAARWRAELQARSAYVAGMNKEGNN